MPLWHPGYSIFYHKLNVDRSDRLFLTYYYYADQMSPEAQAAYREKWPGEVTDGAKIKPRAHDPAILMSDTGGDKWRLALTSDFLAGMGK